MKRYDNGQRRSSVIAIPFDVRAAVNTTIGFLLACLFILGFGAFTATDATGQDNREPMSVLMSQISGQDIETRLLIAYLGRVNNDATDDYPLDVWEYTVHKITNDDGNFFYCGERDTFGDDPELPSVRYLDEYLKLGGKIYEDGTCDMTVIAP